MIQEYSSILCEMYAGSYSYCFKHTLYAHASNGWKSFQACYFSYYSDDYDFAKLDGEGLYDVGDEKGLIEVENMQTVRSGLCVRITFKKLVPGSYLGMYIDFMNESLKVSDIPNPVLYVTSEDYAYGIIGT